MTPDTVSRDDHLAEARAALDRHSWTEAFELLTRADLEGTLSAEDLERLSFAAYWAGLVDECIDAGERAYAAYLESDQEKRAGFACLWVAEQHFHRLADSVGSGWLSRAERLIGEDPDSLEYAWLSRIRTVISFEATGDTAQALRYAETAHEVATRLADRDLQALSLHDQGRILVATGEVERGMGLMEEAMVAAVGGELGALVTGKIYCNMIDICEKLADYGRAIEWDKAARRWCERVGQTSGFPGICRVHRAEIMRLRGSWAEAEHEARRACEELSHFLDFQAIGFREIGEIRLRTGDLSGAEEAFRQAHELGEDPQPGLAMLRLTQGRPDAARELIDRALSDDSLLTLERARLLPAHVEISLAVGDEKGARAAGEELDGIAEEYGSTVLRASAAQTRGAVALAGGELDLAEKSSKRARKLWAESDLPYEAALSRLQLGRVYRARGAAELATLEFEAAQRAFHQLGAERDLTSVNALLRGPTVAVSERIIAAMMFTDIVGSTDLIDVVGDEAWTHLVRWHDQMLRSLFTKHDGMEHDHAGDGFFVVFSQVASAVECAVDIQSTLRDHRAKAGFAPQVRVGVHVAEVTETEGEYRGLEVHKAARIAGQAGGGQIVASREVVEALLTDVAFTDQGTVRVKGIPDPVEIVQIDWDDVRRA